MLKSGTRLTLLTLGSRILGLIREMTRASFLGTSALSDAFTVAFAIPNLLRKLFAENSVSVAFIPTFKQYLDSRTKEETKAFLSAIFTFLSFASTLAVIIGMMLTPFIVPFFGMKTPESILLTRMMFPYLAVISIAALFQGILNSVKIFSPSGFTPILFNLIIIVCTYALSPFMANPGRAMSVGVLLGGTVQALFQIPFVLKSGFRFSFVPLKKAFADPGTKRVLKLIGPTIIGMAAYQLNDLVSTALAGNAGEGVVSSLQYSLRMQELILGIFVASIGTIILPDLTEHAVAKDWPAFNKLLAQAINSIALVTIPVTFYSLVSGKGMITLLFKSRNFSDISVALTLAAFTFHIVGLYFIGMNRVISPAFYAQGDTKSPVIAGIVSFGANIVLALALVGPMRGGGIALALSLASAANTVLLIVYLKKVESVNVGALVKSTVLYALKMIIFSAAAAFPIWYFKKPIYDAFAGHNRFFSQGAPLTVSLIIFAIIGIFLLLISRDSISMQLLGKVKGKMKK